MSIQSSQSSILVVDDNRVNRQLAKAFLERDGWLVTEADHGDLALQFLQDQDFDALLLDISMPGKSGIDILKSLRSSNRNQHIYAVAYTAHALEDERRLIIDAGFDAILLKPISRASLTAVFEKIRVPQQHP